MFRFTSVWTEVILNRNTHAHITTHSSVEGITYVDERSRFSGKKHNELTLTHLDKPIASLYSYPTHKHTNTVRGCKYNLINQELIVYNEFAKMPLIEVSCCNYCCVI